MINITNISNKVSNLIKISIAMLMFFIFTYIAIQSIFLTLRIDGVEEHDSLLYYQYDNIILNILCMVSIIVMIALLNDFFENIDTKIFSIVLSIYVLVLGLFWITSVKSLPTTDSKMMMTYAQHFVYGDYKILEKDYFKLYPFQLGFTLIMQVFIALFQDKSYIALQTLNVFSLIAIYLGIIAITSKLFKSKRIVNITIFLYFGFISAIMFTTFIYGILMGFAFGIWAIYFAIKYIQTEYKPSIVVCAIFLAISIMLKPNNIIIMVAICILLLVKFLDTKKIFDIVSIIVCLVLSSSLTNAVVFGYEQKSNVDLGDGMPKILWINMGIHESNVINGYGWFNKDYGKQIFRDNDYDSQKSSEIAKEQISKQLKRFKNDMNYTNKFFTEKILSTWNEPTYQSMFLSFTAPHDGEITEFVKSVYYGKYNRLILFMANQYQQIIFVFSIPFFVLLFKKKSISLYIMPLTILGGFLYHFIFETKSQYVLIYVIMLIPMAGYGISLIINPKVMERLKLWLKDCATQDTITSI